MVAGCVVPVMEPTGLAPWTWGDETYAVVELENSCFADEGETLEVVAVAPDCNACKRSNAKSKTKTVAENVPSGSVARFSVEIPEVTGADEFGRGGTCLASTCVYAVDDKYAAATAKAAPSAEECILNPANYCKMCSYENMQIDLPMSACLKPVTRIKAALQAKEADVCFTTHFTGLQCKAGSYALDLLDEKKSQPLVKKVGENCETENQGFPGKLPLDGACEALDGGWKLWDDNLQPLARVIDSIDDTYTATETIANAIMEEIARAEDAGATIELLTIIPVTSCPEYNISPGMSPFTVEASQAEPIVMFALCVSGV